MIRTTTSEAAESQKKTASDRLWSSTVRIVLPKMVTGAKTRHLLNNRVFSNLEDALIKKLENISDRSLAPSEAGSVFRPV